jgi:hypothetical protein
MNKEKLGNRIWQTKKSRMNAEARLNRFGFFSSFMVAYYSSTFLCFQLAPKFFENIENLSQVEWVATTCSILVLVFSILLSSQGFKEKALRMKQSYHQLSIAETELENNNVSQAQEMYHSALKEFDNHWTVDFWKIFIFKKLYPDEGKLHFYYRHILTFAYYVGSFLAIFCFSLFPILVFLKYIFPSMVVSP